LPKLSPFKATFPASGFEKLVAVNTHIPLTELALTTQLEKNPFSYFHIFKPQGHFEPNDKTGKFYPFGKNYFQQLKEQKVLVQDTSPALYVYSIDQNEGQSFLGIVANVDAADYANNLIKKHENTLVEKEDLLVKHIAETNLIGEPVLLTYPASSQVNDSMKQITAGLPSISFDSEDGSIHSFWKVTDPRDISILQGAFGEVSSFYIADGHHRCASMYKYIVNNDCGSCSMLAYLVSDEQMKIYPFYRTLKLASAPDWNQVLSHLSQFFNISKHDTLEVSQLTPDSILMCSSEDTYLLNLKPDLRSSEQGILEALNVVILEKYVLTACFDVVDSRQDTRLSYVSGKVSFEAMQQQTQEGVFSLFFALAPLTTKDIFDVSDAGLTMPPKSTYVEPKMHSGAIILEFNQK
jgi:uncharacterized protein (DUF1015 family)